MAQEKSNCENEADMRLGLKVVASLVDQINYLHSLETNNVIVTFQLAKVLTDKGAVKKL